MCCTQTGYHIFNNNNNERQDRQPGISHLEQQAVKATRTKEIKSVGREIEKFNLCKTHLKDKGEKKEVGLEGPNLLLEQR